MAKAYFILEKFDSLESLADTLPVNHPLLPVSGTVHVCTCTILATVSAYTGHDFFGLLKDLLKR